MSLYETNPLEMKTSKNSEAHPMREEIASTEALESIAPRYSGALVGCGYLEHWGSLDKHTGAASGRHRQSSKDSPRPWKEQEVR